MQSLVFLWEGDLTTHREFYRKTKQREIWGHRPWRLEWCCYKPRGLAATRTCKRQGRCPCPQPPEKARPRRHLGCSPITLVRTFGLQNCERINACCFKSPSLRSSVNSSHRAFIQGERSLAEKITAMRFLQLMKYMNHMYCNTWNTVNLKKDQSLNPHVRII